jgi:hypothetical protein
MTAFPQHLKRPRRRFPDNLLFETLDGQRVPYKGYKDVLDNLKQKEEIMGSSILQATIIQLVLEYLLRNLDRKQFHLRTNELGLHIAPKTNVSVDIAIFTTEQLRKLQLDQYYATIAPKIVIEIDVKADTDAFDGDYFDIKTRRLHEFGVERVIWIFTSTEKIHICDANEDWIIRSWAKNAPIIDNIDLNIADLLKEYHDLFET